MIRLNDLKNINSVDKDLGDFTLNMIVASVNVLFEQIENNDNLKLDLASLNELEAFYSATLHILEDSQSYEECVKVHYILEAVKLQKEKLQNETESL